MPPGTPFPDGFTDLQSWTRDQMLDPDWLRVGSDIVGPTPATGPTFNAAFSLDGVSVPWPHRRCWSSRPDLGERWPSRLVATAAEDRLSIKAICSRRLLAECSRRLAVA